MMRELNEAYAILSNPVRRKEYDLPLGYHAVVAKFKAGTKEKLTPIPVRRIGTIPGW